MTADGTVDVLPDTEIITVFRNGDIDGTGSCNNHGGTYAVNGDKVIVKAGDTTVELCSEEVMAQEKVYLAALNSAASFKLVGSQLQVFDGEGYEVLTYRAVEP
jgi:heat shock protein HslJ